MPSVFAKVGLLALMATAVIAQATPSFHCHEMWSGPNTSNDPLSTCFNTGLAPKALDLIIPPLLPILFILILVLIYPCFFVCRQCCNLCGGKHRQPGYCCTRVTPWQEKTSAERDQAYSLGNRWCARIFAVVMLLVVIVAIIVAAIGSAGIKVFADSSISGFAGVADTLDDISTRTKRALSLPNGSFVISSINNGTFSPIDNISSSIRSAAKSAQTLIEPQSLTIRLAATLPILIPIIVIGLLVVFALCSVRRCWPACCTCCYFFTAIAFTILAFIIILLATLTTALNGEVKRYKANEPGILLWYVLPQCNDLVNKTNITGLNQTFTADVTKRTLELCNALTSTCDPSTTFNAGTPNLLFVCNPATFSTTCTTIRGARRVIDGAVAKTGAFPCNGGTVACNASACATNCDNTTLRNTLNSAIEGLTIAGAFEAAIEVVSPVLSCSYLINLLLGIFAGGLDAFQSSLWMLGMANFLTQIACIGAIFAAFRGQKRFYRMSPCSTPIQSATNLSDNVPTL